VAILGTGRPNLEKKLHPLPTLYPGVAVELKFDTALAHKLFAGRQAIRTRAKVMGQARSFNVSVHVSEATHIVLGRDTWKGRYIIVGCGFNAEGQKGLVGFGLVMHSCAAWLTGLCSGGAAHEYNIPTLCVLNCSQATISSDVENTG
jgi:hypothetical protein